MIWVVFDEDDEEGGLDVELVEMGEALRRGFLIGVDVKVEFVEVERGFGTDEKVFLLVVESLGGFEENWDERYVDDPVVVVAVVLR